MSEIIDRPRFEGSSEEQIEQMKKFIFLLVEQLNRIHEQLERGETDGK